MKTIRMFAPGKPETKGSTRGFVVGKRAILTNANPRTKQWEKNVRVVAEFAMGDDPPTRDAVWVTLRFQLVKPKTSKRKWPSVKPDVDKYIRSILDAMTGVVYVDDCQVVVVAASKVYDGDPGVVIDVQEML